MSESMRHEFYDKDVEYAQLHCIDPNSGPLLEVGIEHQEVAALFSKSDLIQMLAFLDSHGR